MNKSKRLPVVDSSAILLVFLAAVIVGFFLADSSFLTASNLNNILLQAAAAAVAAAAMTYVILLADIDLSVGSTMNLSLVVAVTLCSTGTQFDSSTSALVYPVAIVVGLGLGLLNALLITKLQLNSLIVTLGTMTVYQGIALLITQAGTSVTGGAITWLATTKPGGVSVVVLVGLGIGLLATWFLKYRQNGRLLYAVGGDPRSARESGLSQAKARYIAFGFLGACAAVSGLITVGQVGSVEANLGADFAFTVITAVVIGGTSLFGGRGTVLGSILGAVLLATIDGGLNMVNASIYVYDVVRGAILVLAMLADAFGTRLSNERGLRAVQAAR
jgi:ribose/xylose/arabinose/galactoside ABC-type transport system permease subunit